jgi:hypothetical protein
MGLFEGGLGKSTTPFEAGVPRSRGGGRHVAFSRVKMIPGTDNFMAVQLEPYPGAFPKDIRSMGPYELPDYSEAHASAEGIGQIPGMAPGAAPAIPGMTPAAPGAPEPWYQKLIKAGGDIYQTYTSLRKPKTAAPTMPAQAFVYNPTDTGMSATTIVLLVGGGVVVLGVIGFLLLRK